MNTGEMGVHSYGYVWLIINSICTSAYILYIQQITRSIHIHTVGMVYYNNLWSILILAPIAFINNEFQAFSDQTIMSAEFFIVCTMSGVIGFGLNIASFYCVQQTSAVTYAIIGTLNKIPLTLIGYLVFDYDVTKQGIFFTITTFVGGIIYLYGICSRNRGKK